MIVEFISNKKRRSLEQKRKRVIGFNLSVFIINLDPKLKIKTEDSDSDLSSPINYSIKNDREDELERIIMNKIENKERNFFKIIHSNNGLMQEDQSKNYMHKFNH